MYISSTARVGLLGERLHPIRKLGEIGAARRVLGQDFHLIGPVRAEAEFDRAPDLRCDQTG